MGMKVTLGGDRVGSGKKMQVTLHDYGRTTFDLGRVWRSSMTTGAIIPFLVEQTMRGDTAQIDLRTLVRTIPTVGPLFGSFKLQLDVFEVPSRLYMKELHNNKLDIGLNMSNVKYPWVITKARNPFQSEGNPNQLQINPSAISSYLGLRGLGTNDTTPRVGVVTRKVQAVPWLAYADIYKNYFANKQEKIGMVSTGDPDIAGGQARVDWVGLSDAPLGTIGTMWNFWQDTPIGNSRAASRPYMEPGLNGKIVFYGRNLRNLTELSATLVHGEGSVANLITAFKTGGRTDILTWIQNHPETAYFYDDGTRLDVSFTAGDGITKMPIATTANDGTSDWTNWVQILQINATDAAPLDYYNMAKVTNTWAALGGTNIVSFELDLIDQMREYLLSNSAIAPGVNIENGPGWQEFWKHLFPWGTDGSIDDTDIDTHTGANAGVLYRTYLSDRFNAWLNTESIDGEGGITDITSINTTSGSFSMDTLNLAQKLYNLMNRVMVSGGTYHDWHTATWGGAKEFSAETPIYLGGMSAEIQFDEVISATQTPTDVQAGPQPSGVTNKQILGALGGRGRDTGHRGGKIRKRIAEEGYIIGVVSIVPHVDYTEGNKWFLRHEGPDDLHKPELDQIGFQDLITDEFAAYDTRLGSGTITYNSIGKQPAYTEYTTAVNEAYGDFAIDARGMFMTLTRRYEPLSSGAGVADITTYVDPRKYNFPFAALGETEHPFWVQIGVDLKMRRKMTGKVMPIL